MRVAGLILTAVLMGGALRAAQPEGVRRLDGSRISAGQIDAAVLRLMRAAEVTGLGLTIFNGGKVAYSKAYGFRDTERKLPLTENSVMTAASLSKPTFAYLVMQLVGEGKLDLDKPVRQYLPKPLPEYEAYRDLAGDERWRKITPRMLLSHTSGFPNWRWLNEDRKLRMHFEPGARYAYSGEGIALMQLVVEAVTGKGLEELMQERVFGPPGMTRTSMVTQERFTEDYANAYDEWGRSLGPQRRKRADAAGSMQTTLGDFTRLMQAVMVGTGLTEKARDEMLRRQVEIRSKRQFPTLSTETTSDNRKIRLSYGLGWGLYWCQYGKAYFKEGHDEGFRHYTVIFDGPKDGMILMTNSSNGEGIFKELLETLQRNMFTPVDWEGYTPYTKLPKRKPLPVRKEMTLDAKLLDRLTGRYEVSPGLVLTVARIGTRLSLRENQEEVGEMLAESELSFFRENADDVVTFDVDSRGRVTGLAIHTGGRRIPAKRIE